MKKTDSKPEADNARKPTAFESVRETFDSIAIAFILAFLFRTFEAEAFVIPTGSMALTLMGAHKELECPQCGIKYRAGASGENPEDLTRDAPRFTTSSTCPNCRFTAHYPDAPPPTYNGDRILVTKYSYEFSEPRRFDVAVFKNPGEANQNYIKRLVGLPNEELLIYRGDIYARGEGEKSFRIQRKAPEKITSVMQIVYDNDYVLPKIIERGWPKRWVSKPAEAGQSDQWQTSDDFKSFRTSGKFAEEAWLRYQHVVPTTDDWRQLQVGTVAPGVAEPQLITDFCEYNTFGGDHQPVDVPALGLHWVSDLILECEMKLLDRADEQAEVVLELIEGGRAFQCRIQAATGDVELRISRVESFHPRAKGAVVGAGPHRVRFANVDDHLVVWINDKPLKFDGSTNFSATNVAPLDNRPLGDGRRPEDVALDGDTQVPVLDTDVPKDFDLRSPVGIASRGVGVELAHVRVLRDVYYIANSKYNEGAFNLVGAQQRTLVVSDYASDVFGSFAASSLAPNRSQENRLHAFMSNVDVDPDRFREVRAVSFKLAPDQFFMLGDNSAHSSDGRLWESPEHFVKRELLIGKALFVYWPHGLTHVGGSSVALPSLPVLGNTYWPNFADMRLIR